VRMATGRMCAVEMLQTGDRLSSLDGEAEVLRIDPCHHTLVELCIGDERLRIASYHRLYDEDDLPVRVESLREGDRIATLEGLRAVSSVRVVSDSALIYRIGVSHAGTCLLGELGVVAEANNLGAAVARTNIVRPFAGGV
jgi:hypothetical protein